MKTAIELYRHLYGSRMLEKLPAGLSPRGRLLVADDFVDYHDTVLWTKAVTGSSPSTVALAAGAGGQVALTTNGEDNNYAVMGQTGAPFSPSVNRRMAFEALLKVTEGNTDDANVLVGLSSVRGSTALQDNGAGPIASFSGAVFYKVDGGTKWQFRVSNGTTNDTAADLLTVTSGSFVRLGAILVPSADGVNYEVTPYVNDVAGETLEVAIANLAAMGLVAAVKGGGAHAEVVTVDYLLGVADR